MAIPVAVAACTPMTCSLLVQYFPTLPNPGIYVEIILIPTWGDIRKSVGCTVLYILVDLFVDTSA